MKVLYELENILEIIKSTYPFPVDFEQAWQWLGIKNRKRIERLLSTYFIEEIDFTQLQQKGFICVNEKRVFTNSIALSLECLKALALMLNNSRSRKLRKDLIRCEAAVGSLSQLALLKTEESQQAEAKFLQLETVLKVVFQQLYEPMTKIRMAIEMLRIQQLKYKSIIYLNILQISYSQILELFDNLVKLQELNQPENLQIMQLFKLSEDDAGMTFNEKTQPVSNKISNDKVIRLSEKVSPATTGRKTKREDSSGLKITCPRCNSSLINKWGHINSKQKYICCSCKRQFLEFYDRNIYSNQEIENCLKMYSDGLRTREIERVTGIGHSTIIYWLKKMSSTSASKGTMK